MNAAELIARQIYRLIPHGRSVALSEILNTESMTPVQAKEAMDEVLAGLRWLIEMSLIIDIGYGYYRRTEVLEYSSKEISNTPSDLMGIYKTQNKEGKP